MTRDELTGMVTTMKDTAVGVVRQYAAARCPNVPDTTVRAIEGALGDISIDEAFDALDRINLENVRR